MIDKIIDLILKLNKKFFFKKSHPFNIEKDGILNLNYSDFEYNHTKGLLDMYDKLLPVTKILGTGTLKKILEVGCGGGGKSVYIAEKYNCEVIGIDIEDNFLDQANSFARQKKVDNLVNFYKKSALNTDFEVDKFDVIIMSDVIEHIPETNKLFDEMWRILKPGGIILFDFAPYYHYFGHHLWDTIQIPWIHLFFTDKFLITLYKKSVENLVDGKQRINLRIGKKKINNSVQVPKDKNLNPGTGTEFEEEVFSNKFYEKEAFTYLNKITRKDFEKVMGRYVKKNKINDFKIQYYMIKNMSFLSKVPFLREIFIRHIVGYIKK